MVEGQATYLVMELLGICVGADESPFVGALDQDVACVHLHRFETATI